MTAGEQTLAQRLDEIIARYPSRRSAILPALHVAQGEYGWLPPEAMEAVADALETTPAFVQSIASFYDMFHLRPVGQHLIEVCTNVACSLRGAGEVLDEFGRQLDVHPGETTADGRFTLRSVECLGGCGTAPTVAVDNRFREFFTVAQVKPLLTELRATSHSWTDEEKKV